MHEGAVLDSDFETILVPTDGSDVANAAADHAIGLADGTDAALHVVHVVDVAATSRLGESAAVLAGLEDAGREAVDDVIGRADEAEVRSVQASVLSGSPARSILDYTDDHDIGLIVMGTHGRSGLERYLIGSVTETVTRLADVPVLSVPDRSDGG
jgi:nucleotide-binding universal stress UspA family protein